MFFYDARVRTLWVRFVVSYDMSYRYTGFEWIYGENLKMYRSPLMYLTIVKFVAVRKRAEIF